MNYFLIALVTLLVVINTQSNNTVQDALTNQLSSSFAKQNESLNTQLLAQIPNNNKPFVISNQSQVESPKKQKISQDKQSSEYKEQNKVKIGSQLKEQKKQYLEKKDIQQAKIPSKKDSQVKTLNQTKKQNSKQIKQTQPSENDIKIIPLTAQYGRQKTKSSLVQSTSQKSKSIKEKSKADQVQIKAQKISDKITTKEKQTSNVEATNQSKIIDKLIEDVKNNKDQLREQSKQQIIHYLQNKKQQNHLRQQTKETETSKLQAKDTEQTTLKRPKQYVLITDQVIDVSQKSKQTKQMDNSTILVIIVLTFIISIPIVREIRSRNDNQKEQHRKDSDTTLVTSKQDVQKNEGQKYYNQLNNQSAYQIGEEMI